MCCDGWSNSKFIESVREIERVRIIVTFNFLYSARSFNKETLQGDSSADGELQT